MNRQNYLDTATDVICKQRPAIHGGAEDSFRLIANYWSTFLSQKLNHPVSITPAEVGVLMSLFKTARWQMNPDHSDNIVDNLGYLALAGELQDNDTWILSNT